MKQKIEKKEFPVYLSDKPTKEPSHIADAIANEILLNAKQNRIIGLLGSWGCGKSSTIEVIKEKLKDTCSILEYDAWENEKFPFKVGFLKSIINQFDNNENDKALNQIKSELKELEQINEKQETKEFSIINFENLITAIPLLFYPLAFDLLDINNNFAFLENWNEFQEKSFIFHYIVYLVAFSFITIVNKRLLTRDKVVCKKNILGRLKSFYNDFIKSEQKREFLLIKWGDFVSVAVISLLTSIIQDLTLLILFLPASIWFNFNFTKLILKLINPQNDFYIFSGTTPETSSFITVNKSPEPSLIEFQNLYQKILKYNDQAKNKPYLIIIDNIDRIEIDEAKRIWSTLKGMILKNNKDNIYTNIIIPVDEDQILRLYNEQEQKELNIDNKSASFVQKTFDITYRVPPFIMDNIKEVLNKKLDEAFGKGGINEEDKLSILNIFNSRNYSNKEDFVISSYAGQATPRKIIKLINEVISLYKNSVFKDISIVTMFAYATHYNNISSKLQNKNIKDLLPKDSITLINIEQEYLAELISLYYGVHKECAVKIAKKDDLIDKIYKEDSYKEIDIQVDNIWQLLSEIINETIIDKPFSSLSKLLNNLMHIKEKLDFEQFSYLTNLIYKQIEKLTNIDNYNSLDSSVIGNSLEMTNNPSDHALKILDLAFRFNKTKDEYSEKESDNWLNFILQIIDKHKIKKENLYNIAKPLPVELYKNIISLIQDQNVLIDSDVLKLEENADLFAFEDNNIILNNINFIVNNPPNKERLSSWNKKLNEIVPSLISLLTTNNQESIDLLYLIIKNLRKDNEALTDFIKSSEYLTKVLTPNANNIELLAKATAILAYFDPTLEQAWGNSSRQPNSHPWRKVFSETSELFIDNFINTYISLTQDLLSIYDLSSHFQNRNIYQTYVIENIDNYTLNSEKFFIEFDKFNEEHVDILFDKFLKNKNAIKTIEDLTFTKDNSNWLYYLSLKNTIKEHVLNNAEVYLDQIEEEIWQKEARDCSINFKIATNLQSENLLFRKVFTNLDSIMMETGINNFINSMQNEIENLKVFDKKYNFINDLLDKNLKAIDDFNLLLVNFNESIIRWLKKTTHDSNSLFTDFIRKINNSDWLITHSALIEKHIINSESNDAFFEKWKNNEFVTNAYIKIFNQTNDIVKE